MILKEKMGKQKRKLQTKMTLQRTYSAHQVSPVVRISSRIWQPSPRNYPFHEPSERLEPAAAARVPKSSGVWLRRRTARRRHSLFLGFLGYPLCESRFKTIGALDPCAHSRRNPSDCF